jgi:hypothetical protein
MKVSTFSELRWKERLLVFALVPLAVWFGLDWMNTRHLNMSGYCIPEQRYITNEEMIVTAIYNTFKTKVELQSVTALTSYHDYRARENRVFRPHQDFTKEDVRTFLKTPLGRLCCKAVPANNGGVWIATLGQFSEDEYRLTQRGRKSGQLKGYVLMEHRNIDIVDNKESGAAKYYVYAIPVTNCGEIPTSGHVTTMATSIIEVTRKLYSIDPSKYPPAPRYADVLKITGENK